MRHWQRGSTPWLSVKRRRNLATVADCGVSQCSLTRPGVANVLLSSNFQIIVSQCYLIFTILFSQLSDLSRLVFGTVSYKVFRKLRNMAVIVSQCSANSVSQCFANGHYTQFRRYGVLQFSVRKFSSFASFLQWAVADGGPAATVTSTGRAELGRKAT